MKIITLLTKKTYALYFIILLLSLLSCVLFLSDSAAAESKYVWDGNTIVETKDDGTKQTYKYSDTEGNIVHFSNGKQNTDKQTIANGGIVSSKDCVESHIDLIKGSTPVIADKYQSTAPTLQAMNSGNLFCNYDSDGNSSTPESLEILIGNPKNGNKDLNNTLGLAGCPNSGTKDKNLPKSTNYDCLGGGAVIKGEYDKNGKDSNPQKNDPNKEGQDEEKPVDNEAGCDNALAPFGWVLCPVMNIADGFYGWFKDLIGGLLFFESDKYTDNGLYDSWKTMVTIANSIIVLVAIVMIAAQIFNFEVFSAYTVKKALPRIIIAAILIQLSWFMVTTGIQVVNAIGSGIYWLLVAPFAIESDGGGVLEIGAILGANSSAPSTTDDVGNAIGLGTVSLLMAGAVAGAVLTGAWLSIVLMAVGVVISLVVAVITLLLREAVLIVLIALAPIAIALWILPGTSGIWNLWWKTFSRLLLMYPLIMLLFAGGTISAILLSSSQTYINYIFAIVAYFIPIFLIGATYKFAGGAFASMANFTGKMGSKARSGGMFGLRDKAKFNKENSSWSLAKKSRESDRQRRAQSGYANKLTGTGRYAKFLQGRAGVDELGRQRAMAGAAATITSEKQQAYKNDEALAEFQIQKLAETADRNIYKVDVNGDRVTDAEGKYVVTGQKSLYEAQSEVRAGIMSATTGETAEINGQKVQISRALQDHTALKSLQNKDGSDGLLNYVAENHDSLSSLATENGEAYSTLIKHAPAVAKSDGPSVTDPGNRSYQQAIENFSEISHKKWKEDTIGALQMQLADNPSEGIANLTQMARNSAIKTNDLAMISKAVGFDLSELRNDENAVLDYTPPAPLPPGTSGPLPRGRLKLQ